VARNWLTEPVRPAELVPGSMPAARSPGGMLGPSWCGARQPALVANRREDARGLGVALAMSGVVGA
jgi:hypothetical protein